MAGFVNFDGTSGNYGNMTSFTSPPADADVRFRISLVDWTPAAGCAPLATYPNGWIFRVDTDGKLTVHDNVDNVTSTAATGIANGTVSWIRRSTHLVRHY